MIGVFTVACGRNEDTDTLNNSNEVTKETVLETEEEREEEETKEIEEQAIIKETTSDESDKSTEVEDSKKFLDGAEEVLYKFFEAMANQDIEIAREYVLYYDLEFPLHPLEDMRSYYIENKPLYTVGVEELSEDMKAIKVKIKGQNEELEEDYLLKKVNDNWYVATEGIVSRQQSIYTDDLVEDGKYGIYLENIYEYYNGVLTYVISMVNNTNEKLHYGFVNRGGVIYESNVGKKFIEMDQNLEVNPYSKGQFYFTVDPAEGPVKSITLTEFMLGLEPMTREEKVNIGEMLAE
ncbi:MAG: hypothetical protein GX995_07305 [Clostridiales bacterium]|nr:hypothetical protein [Clostridiales bacterium]